jgi:hypothetical protein
MLIYQRVCPIINPSNSNCSWNFLTGTEKYSGNPFETFGKKNEKRAVFG